MSETEKTAGSIELVEQGSSLKEPIETSPQNEPEIDPVAERKLVKKLDWILLPLFIVIYGLNYIDRSVSLEWLFPRLLKISSPSRTAIGEWYSRLRPYAPLTTIVQEMPKSQVSKGTSGCREQN